MRLREAVLPWRELPASLRLLRVAAAAFLVLVLGLMVTVGSIETVALRQPQSSGHGYLYPHRVKGAIHYLSAKQERVYRVAHPLLMPGLGVLFLLLGAARTCEYRLSKRRRQAALQQIADRIEESWGR